MHILDAQLHQFGAYLHHDDAFLHHFTGSVFFAANKHRLQTQTLHEAVKATKKMSIPKLVRKKIFFYNFPGNKIPGLRV